MRAGGGSRGTASWPHLLMCNRPFRGFCLTTVAQSLVFFKSRAVLCTLAASFLCRHGCGGLAVWRLCKWSALARTNSQTIPFSYYLLGVLFLPSLFHCFVFQIFFIRFAFLNRQGKTRCGLKQMEMNRFLLTFKIKWCDRLRADSALKFIIRYFINWMSWHLPCFEPTA